MRKTITKIRRRKTKQAILHPTVMIMPAGALKLVLPVSKRNVIYCPDGEEAGVVKVMVSVGPIPVGRFVVEVPCIHCTSIV